MNNLVKIEFMPMDPLQYSTLDDGGIKFVPKNNSSTIEIMNKKICPHLYPCLVVET